MRYFKAIRMSGIILDRKEKNDLIIKHFSNLLWASDNIIKKINMRICFYAKWGFNKLVI